MSAAKPTLTRYWTTASRDYNGRLPEDLCIRIEWTADGVAHTACGHFSGESIEWLYGTPPDAIDDQATDCALDAGEYAETCGATFEGHETLGAMYSACERTCLACGARVESIDHLSREGQCSYCFIKAKAAKEADAADRIFRRIDSDLGMKGAI